MSVKYADLAPVTYIPRTADQDIIITVVIGDAADDSSSYSVYLGQQLKSTNKDAVLGKKADVQGKTTLIVASVVDVLEETNWTSLTVFVKEGILAPVTFGPYAEQVAEHLDTVIYTLKITHQ